MAKNSSRKILPKSHTLDNVVETAHELAQQADALEVGDVVSEYQKKWAAQIEEIIQTHKTYADKYYILQWIQKEYGLVNLLRNKCFVRKTKPDADWNTDCYSFDNRTGDFAVEWTLPPKEAATTILRNPSQYHPFLVQSIQRFLAGELNDPQGPSPDSSAQ